MKQKEEKRARGSGSIYQNGSTVLWIKFFDRGIPRRESSHSSDRRIAEKLLKKRLAEVETKIYVPRENIRVDELIADLISDYRVNSQKSTAHVERRWKLHLMAFFQSDAALAFLIQPGSMGVVQPPSFVCLKAIFE